MELTRQELELIGQQVRKAAGFYPGMGLSSVQLDALAKLAYNIFSPEVAKIPHVTPEMAGERWGGQFYTFKSILNPNATGLPAPVGPGNRNAIASITTSTLSSYYTTLGFDQSVIDEEFEQERGFDDPVKNARITCMHNVLKNYDILITDGNLGAPGNGDGGNGFNLGTAATPSPAASATGGAIPAATKVTVSCVELTAFGMIPANNGSYDGSGSPAYKAGHSGYQGLSQTISRAVAGTAATGSGTDILPLGTGILGSAASVTTPSSTSTGSVVASVAPSVGAFGWAWYVSVAPSPSTANSYFYAVTRSPQVTITAAASSSNQAASALAAVDYSYNSASVQSGQNNGANDFDGTFAYIAGSQNSNGGSLSAGGAGFNQFRNLLGAGFTSDLAGGVVEIDAAVQDQFLAYQAVPDEIVCGVNAIGPLTKAVLGGGVSSNLRFNSEVSGDGLVGGATLLQHYRLKFSPDGRARVIPISVSPNIPANAVWMPTRTNPFPSTSATIPATLQLAEIKPMFSKDFAVTNRTWQLGTYVETTLVNRAPFIGIVFAGAGY